MLCSPIFSVQKQFKIQNIILTTDKDIILNESSFPYVDTEYYGVKEVKDNPMVASLLNLSSKTDLAVVRKLIKILTYIVFLKNS